MDFSSKNKSNKEGITPVTCKILNGLAKKEEKLEYLNIPVAEVVIVGFAAKYIEQETRIILGLWDQTGYIEVSFYNKNESETHQGLEGYYFIEKGIVKVIGKVKSQKDSIRIDGAKVMKTDLNDFFYHKLEVVSDWLYLTNDHIVEEEALNKKTNNSNINNVLTNNKNNGSEAGAKAEKILNAVNDLIRNYSQTNVQEIIENTGFNENEVIQVLKSLSAQGFFVYDESSQDIFSL